jgi:hypothetical protein
MTEDAFGRGHVDGARNAGRHVYGEVEADGTSTWGPDRRRAIFGAAGLALWFGFKLAAAVRGGWQAAFPDATSAVMSVAIALGVGVPTWIAWNAHRRFGTSRLIPGQPQVHPGETFHGVLEAGPALAFAREVRLDLIEMHRSTTFDLLPESWLFGRHVRATASIPAAAFQVMAGSTRVPFSLPVPADGLVSSRDSRLGFSPLPPFLATRETEHAWRIRVSAGVEGARYRATFHVIVGPVAAVADEPPYAPRPIVIPPSDRIRRPPT